MEVTVSQNKPKERGGRRTNGNPEQGTSGREPKAEKLTPGWIWELERSPGGKEWL
jgi:hypothetical protein